MTPGKIVALSAVLGCGAYFFWTLTDWLAIKDSMEPSEFQRHLTAYPLSPFAPFVRAKLAGSEDWELVRNSRDPPELTAYIEKFPGSLYYSFVALRLNRLEAIASGKYSPVLLPNSSRRVLNPEEINSLNCTQLWTARNEIYYSVGYCFSTEAAINALRQTRTECPYDNCKLFKKFNALAQDVISNTENENISKLRRQEREQGCRVPERVVGICSQ
jgi:YARHG domain